MSFHPPPLFLVGDVVLDLLFNVYVLYFVICPFVPFLAIVLSVLLRFTDSDYPFGIFKVNSSCCQLWHIWFHLSLSTLVQPRGFVWVCCSIFNLLCCDLWIIVNLFVRLLVIVLLRYGPSWSWSYGSWIYNYLCNQCLSPLMFVSSKLDQG